MTPESPPAAPERSARVRDAARVLPLVGLFVLLPPVIGLFTAPVEIAGVPLIVVYVFTVWGALVACAALLARALGRDPDGESRDPGPSD